MPLKHHAVVSDISPRTATIGITRFHLASETLEWDARAAAIFESTGDRPAIDVWRDRVHPDDRDLVKALFEDARESIGAECVYRIVLPDSRFRHVLTRSVAIETDPDGEAAVLTGVVFEIEPAADSHSLLTDVLDSVSIGFAILDRDMIVRYINAESENHLGIPRSQILGRHIHDPLPATKGSYFDDLHAEVIRTQGEVRKQVESVYLPGTVFDVTANYVDGAVAINFRDVTEATLSTGRILESYRSLLAKSRLDDLTGVLNRSALFERISSISCESTLPTALLFIDIDDFKAINDTHGHIDGDLVLRTTAQRLAAQCDARTVIGRIGGDEFVAAVFPDGVPGASRNADELAAKMHAATRVPISVTGSDVHMTISIGVAHNRAQSSLEDLLTAADVALYRAKADAKNVRP